MSEKGRYHIQDYRAAPLGSRRPFSASSGPPYFWSSRRSAGPSSEAEKLRDRLGESEEQYSILFNKTPSAIILTRADPRAAEKENAAATDSLQGLQGIRILLVEDDKCTGEATSGLLGELGASVQLKTSAKDALETLSEDVPDILISDIAMPIEDGYSLIRKVRGSPVTEFALFPQSP